MRFKVLFLSLAGLMLAAQSSAVLANDGMKHGKHITVKEADADADGTLSLDEFKATHGKNAEKCFSNMDKDNDGTLDQKEIDDSEYHGMHKRMRKQSN